MDSSFRTINLLYQSTAAWPLRTIAWQVSIFNYVPPLLLCSMLFMGLGWRGGDRGNINKQDLTPGSFSGRANFLMDDTQYYGGSHHDFENISLQDLALNLLRLPLRCVANTDATGLDSNKGSS